MTRSSRRLLAAGAAALLAPLVAPAGAAAQAPAFARLSLVEQKVELAKKDAKWQSAVEGGPVDIGEGIRTGPQSVARLELPWMALSLSPASILRFPDERLLSAELDQGRAVVEADGHDALKLVTAGAEVRGEGRAVVRREGKNTSVACLAGRFFLSGGTRTVTLTAGKGSVVSDGGEPSAPADLPPPPDKGLYPGRDPVYTSPGAPLDLKWEGDASAYQVEVLPVGSDVVLLQRDVAQSPARIEVPWEGAFRWRVSSRDSRGLEGAPSADGLIAVDAAK
jgi:hypothetical protein